MKKIFFLLLILPASVSLQAQLKNTKWKGTIQTDNTLNVVFNYKSDTLDASNEADHSNIETMTYTVKDSILTLQKIYGKSNCDGTSPGKYKFYIKNDVLTVTLLSDSCIDRTSALNNSKWTKMK